MGCFPLYLEAYMSEESTLTEYEIDTSFTFTGTFKIQAESEAQAIEYVERHCGLVLGRDIHSSLPEDIVDWDFNCHPTKEILTT